MSHDSWRRGPRSLEHLGTSCENTWPGLEFSGIRKTRTSSAVPRWNNDDSFLDRRIARSADDGSSSSNGIILDDEGFPRLGQRLFKRKLNGGESFTRDDNFRESIEIIGDDSSASSSFNDREKRFAKGSKKPRKSDVICIDIKKVLERQRSLSESQTTSSVKPRIRLNVNLTVRNPLDSSKVVQCRRGKQIEGERAKRISKLKRVIFRERDNKRQINRQRWNLFEIERAEAAEKDLNEMGFDRLKISPDAGEPETTFVRALSAMTLFENGHKKPASLESKNNHDYSERCNNVTKRLEDLVICKEEDNFNREMETRKGYSLLDPIVVEKTFSLKICDETGETVEDISKSNVTSNSEEKEEEIKGNSINSSRKKHSKKFREYCTNNLTLGLNTTVEIFLAEIYRLQRRMYDRDEVKGRSRRRYYAGFKEVIKHVESKKIRFVVIAPDLEGISDEPEGLNECVKKLIAACKGREIVFCFALNKRKLGYFTHKKGNVSCVGVTNYSGLEEQFKDVLTEIILARNSYGRENSLEDQRESREFEDALLSTKINLLFRTLAIGS